MGIMIPIMFAMHKESPSHEIYTRFNKQKNYQCVLQKMGASFGAVYCTIIDGTAPEFKMHQDDDHTVILITGIICTFQEYSDSKNSEFRLMQF